MARPEFKVDDKVRRIAGDDRPALGLFRDRVYTVRANMGAGYILLEEIPQNLPYWLSEFFELAEEKQETEESTYEWWNSDLPAG